MKSSRDIKNALYEQVARIAKAAANPKRLELIEVLSQGEKNVERLASEAEISVKLASAHLKELKQARLVATRQAGRQVYYRLAGPQVADLWVTLHTLAEERLFELQAVMRELVSSPDALSSLDGEQLLAQARRGDVVVIDVRPENEYAATHLPFARSMPLAELKRRLGELPTDKPIVAYCRGPFCLMAKEAVELLAREGLRATRFEKGVAEWRTLGLPLDVPQDQEQEEESTH